MYYKSIFALQNMKKQIPLNSNSYRKNYVNLKAIYLHIYFMFNIELSDRNYNLNIFSHI